MSYENVLPYGLDISGQAMMRRLMRRAEVIFARGGTADELQRSLSNLPTEIATVAQELILGKSINEMAGVELDTPRERAIKKWRKGIAEFLSSKGPI